MVRLTFQLHNNMNISMVAAIGRNNELGKDNKLIWHLKKDLKFFKDLTTGHVIVMGRRTFESLPKMLPNRHHVVITSNNNLSKDIEIFNNIENFLKEYESFEDEIFIIGGASIYNEFLDYSNKLYLTEIDAEDKDSDVYFPEFNKSLWDRNIIDEENDNNIRYKHVLYRRLK